MQPTNLFQYYQSQGQSLPSVSARSPLYKQYGGRDTYIGSAQQNEFLLARLQGQQFPQNQISVSAKPAEMEFARYSANLQNIISPPKQKTSLQQTTPLQNNQQAQDIYSDQYTRLLDQQQLRGDATTNALITTLKAQSQRQKDQLASQTENYQRGLQLLGIQQNKAQSTPDLLMGQIQQVQNEYMGRIQDIDAEMNFAISEAEQARSERNLSIFREKMKYIEQLKKEKNDTLREAYDRMKLESNISEIQAGLYYDEMQKLNDTDKEAFLIELSNRFNIPLPALVKAISDEHALRDKGRARGRTGGNTEKRLTLDKINKYKNDYPQFADRIDFGMTEQEVADIIYGEEVKTEAIEQVAKFKRLSSRRIRKLNEIGISDKMIKIIIRFLSEGATIEEIIADSNIREDQASLLKQYTKEF